MSVTDNPLEVVSRAIADSQFLRSVERMRSDVGTAFVRDAAVLRAPTPKEIALLERLGNTADDWSRIWVSPTFNPQRLRNCDFHGNVVLGNFSSLISLPEGTKLPSGVYDSALADCIVGDDALVRHVGLLSGYAVGEGAILTNCGSIACTHRTTFGNGQSLPLGIETGGREIPVFAEISLPLIGLLTSGPYRQKYLHEYQLLIAEYLCRAASTRGIIENGAIVRNTMKLWNTYVGPHARVEESASVESCTVLSSLTESTHIQSGACVADTLLQWGSSCANGAIVERAVLMEHSRVENHGTICDSVIGPNTTVARGEVCASLVGPFVGFHHQALLIAVRWPEGKGNVSYAAAVGCNHTSRAPDQECWLGEGTFLGLGAKLQFPIDLSRAPYTVVASGAVLFPQKMVFPFSLIKSPANCPSGVSTCCNELVPAWVLSDNLYAIQRAQSKFRTRNRASRQVFDFEVFRPETVDLMREACSRLSDVELVREIYSERDIKGLGKNYLTEPHRVQAVNVYTFFIRYYALLGLLQQTGDWLDSHDTESVDDVLMLPTCDPRWEHQRLVLREDLNLPDVVEGLRDLPEMLENVGVGVEQSKQKDDRRGEHIIDDYSQTHSPAYRDPIVRETWGEVRRLQVQTRAILARLEHRPHIRNGYHVAVKGLA
jgi:hypothetical protein